MVFVSSIALLISSCFAASRHIEAYGEYAPEPHHSYKSAHRYFEPHPRYHYASRTTREKEEPLIKQLDLLPTAASLAFSLYAKGTQDYICRENFWTLKTPDALLYKGYKPVGRHGSGQDGNPFWELKDGSRFVGKKERNATVNVDAIPWLLLSKVSSSGSMSRIIAAVRADTKGGLAPSSRCSGEEEVDIPYSATYYFYTN